MKKQHLAVILCLSAFIGCGNCEGILPYAVVNGEFRINGRLKIYSNGREFMLPDSLNARGGQYDFAAPLRFYMEKGTLRHKLTADSIKIAFADGKTKTDYNCSLFRTNQRVTCEKDVTSFFRIDNYTYRRNGKNTTQIDKTDTSCNQPFYIYTVSERDYLEAR